MNMKVEQQYITLFKESRDLLDNNSAPVMNKYRQEAFDNFERLGFPSKKVEEYKYTPVSKYFEQEYGLNLSRLDIPSKPRDLFSCDVPGMDSIQAFLVNDLFHQEAVKGLPKGVLLGSLKELAETHPELVEKYYAKIANHSKDAIVSFNTAFAQDGLLLYVPKNTMIEQPIQLINLLRSDVDLMSNRRILIVLEEGAQAKVLICNHTIDQVNFIQTGVTEVFVGANAQLDFYELEETHTQTVRFNNLTVHQQADSNVLLNNMTLHNGVTRNSTEVVLKGKGAHIDCHGMAVEDQNQHVDNTTLIDHTVAHCTSNELFKYVLDDHSVGAFTGMILVRPDAQQTNSQQTNRALCVTRDAKMYARPQLEIYADDVRCGHGATVGQLDETALFYMQARGISEREARLLLMFAFVNEVIDTISIDALKERLHTLVEQRFRGEVQKCSECSICK